MTDRNNTMNLPSGDPARLAAPNPQAPPTTMLAQIEAARERLSKAEQRVADYVLGHADDIMNQSIAALAGNIGVSQPTVARFCMALGLTGFKEFKLRLVQSLAGGVPFVHRDVGAGDPASALVAKVLDRTIAALMRVRNELDATALDQAIHLLASARKIEFYGAGNSGIIAADAQHKFFRLGVPTVAYADAHIHGMAAILLQPGDVVVAISNTGRTRDVLRSVESALQAGASVVAITASGSPLARLSTVALCGRAGGGGGAQPGTATLGAVGKSQTESTGAARTPKQDPCFGSEWRTAQRALTQQGSNRGLAGLKLSPLPRNPVVRHTS